MRHVAVPCWIRSPLVACLLAMVLTPGAAPAQTIDAFNPGANSTITAFAVQPDGKVVVGGFFTTIGGGGTGSVARNRLARLLPDGTVDPSFDPGANGAVYTLGIQPDGKILVGGAFTTLGGVGRSGIGRLNADGTLDASFNPGTNGFVNAFAQLADGSIVVGGGFTTIGGGGSGSTTRLHIAKVSASGTVDGAFNPGAQNEVRALAPYGTQILVGGNFTTLGGSSRLYIGRLNSDGSLDASFNPGISPVPGNDFVVFALAVEANGTILVGGNFVGVGGGSGTTPRANLARIDGSGAVDPFDPGASGNVSSIAVEAGGRIIVSGFFTTLGGAPRQGIGRLEANGTIEPTFAPGGSVGVAALGLQADGRVLLGGAFTSLAGGSVTRNRIARVHNGPSEQSLTVGAGNTSVTWARSGTAPEVDRVTFESTTNGTAWTPLGAGSRVAGGWQLTGLSVAPDPNLRMRARGVYSTDGSASLAEQSAPAAGVNAIANGTFANGTTSWSTFALPDASGMAFNVADGVFQFNRTGTQAVVFQNTGVAAAANTPMTAVFRLGNSDTVRKRISILVHDGDFLDLHVCTFWLPANAPLLPYSIRTHTTKAWTNATVSFYAATGGSGGFYQVDEVALFVGAGPSLETTCGDPWTPAAPGGPNGPELMVNGNFTAGLAPWSLFGQISGAVNSGVFEFIKLAGAPAGVVLQATGQPIAPNQTLSATFQLGNSSGVRKRVTVIVHDASFADLSACTFWLPPGQALSTYTMRMFTTLAWTNATLSVYPATVGADQWIRLDNVSLQQTPVIAVTGTACIEPGGSGVAPRPLGPDEGWTGAPAPTAPGPVDGWIADGFDLLDGAGQAWVAQADVARAQVLALADAIDLSEAVTARLTLTSRVAGHAVGRIQITTDDGVTWDTVLVAGPTDSSVGITVDLAAYLGQTIRVRFVLEAETGSDSAGTWLIDEVSIEDE